MAASTPVFFMFGLTAGLAGPHSSFPRVELCVEPQFIDRRRRRECEEDSGKESRRTALNRCVLQTILGGSRGSAMAQPQSGSGKGLAGQERCMAFSKGLGCKRNG